MRHVFLIQQTSDPEHFLKKIVPLKQLRNKRGWEGFVFFQKKCQNLNKF
jgi:hypothetical protein